MSCLGLVFLSRLEYVFRLASLKEEQIRLIPLLAIGYLLSVPHIAERRVTDDFI
jgi:hypothetical protein